LFRFLSFGVVSGFGPASVLVKVDFVGHFAVVESTANHAYDPVATRPLPTAGGLVAGLGGLPLLRRRGAG